MSPGCNKRTARADKVTSKRSLGHLQRKERSQRKSATDRERKRERDVWQATACYATQRRRKEGGERERGGHMHIRRLMLPAIYLRIRNLLKCCQRQRQNLEHTRKMQRLQRRKRSRSAKKGWRKEEQEEGKGGQRRGKRKVNAQSKRNLSVAVNQQTAGRTSCDPIE